MYSLNFTHLDSTLCLKKKWVGVIFNVTLHADVWPPAARIQAVHRLRIEPIMILMSFWGIAANSRRNKTCSNIIPASDLMP